MTRLASLAFAGLLPGGLLPAACGMPLPDEGAAAGDPAAAAAGPPAVSGNLAAAAAGARRFAAGSTGLRGPGEAAAEPTRPGIRGVRAGPLRLAGYVDVSGAGFGSGPGQAVVLRLAGPFEPEGGVSRWIDVDVVPERPGDDRLRLVIDESDALGEAIDFRGEAGWWFVDVTPVLVSEGASVVGEPFRTTFRVAGPRQVVVLRFLPGYAGALVRFGLLAADRAVRDRILGVLRRDYAGVAIEFRETVPDDCALWSQVDFDGPDRNGLGAFGNDPTPGKDVGNARLFDRIGGWNAQTEAEGVAAWGGIFVESFLAFGPSSPDPSPLASPLFDAVFDPFRPDRGGRPATEAEASVPFAFVGAGGAGCPASHRPQRLACAVWTLGNLIGSAASHEVAHTLGLAEPYGPSDLVHHPGDRIGVLMEEGRARPFEERAELAGQGPARFTDEDLAYLRAILPPDDREPAP